jgi:hypothetical protein
MGRKIYQTGVVTSHHGDITSMFWPTCGYSETMIFSAEFIREMRSTLVYFKRISRICSS